MLRRHLYIESGPWQLFFFRRDLNITRRERIGLFNSVMSNDYLLLEYIRRFLGDFHCVLLPVPLVMYLLKMKLQIS